MRLLLAILALMFTVPAAAQENRLWSDQPLFTTADEIWPRSYSDEDSFGCVTIMLTGVWRLERAGAATEWVRMSIDGAYHCEQRYTVFVPGAREPAAAAGRLVVFAKIDDVAGGELWVMQSGWADNIVRRPGSPPIEYRLLFRPEWQSDHSAFTVLPIDCTALPEPRPARPGRRGACGVADLETLRTFAQAMAGREPAGTFSFTGSR